MFLFSSESIKPSLPELEFRKAIKKEYHYDSEMNKVTRYGEDLTQTGKELAKVTVDFFLKKVYHYFSLEPKASPVCSHLYITSNK
jgi:hypothetical protein